MFSTQHAFNKTIISGGKKTCQMRWPTDEEWAERARSRKVLRRTGTRGRVTIETPDAETIDAAFFEKIRMPEEGGPEFDAAEAAKAVAGLERSEVIESSLDGAEIRCVLDVPGAETTHVLRIPSQRQILDLGRKSVKISDAGRKGVFITVTLEESGALYDSLLVRTEGYEGDVVPIIHKDAVVQSTLLLIQELEGEDRPR
jgi:hypothetical protein